VALFTPPSRVTTLAFKVTALALMTSLPTLLTMSLLPERAAVPGNGITLSVALVIGAPDFCDPVVV
jgi:hypothetical protein